MRNRFRTAWSVHSAVTLLTLLVIISGFARLDIAKHSWIKIVAKWKKGPKAIYSNCLLRGLYILPAFHRTIHAIQTWWTTDRLWIHQGKRALSANSAHEPSEPNALLTRKRNNPKRCAVPAHPIQIHMSPGESGPVLSGIPGPNPSPDGREKKGLKKPLSPFPPHL